MGMCPGSPGQGQAVPAPRPPLGVAGVSSPEARVPGSPSGVAAGLDSQGLQPAAEALRYASEWLPADKGDREVVWGAAHTGGTPAPQRSPCSCPAPTRPRAVKCTPQCTYHLVIPSCSGRAEVPPALATPTRPTQPQPLSARDRQPCSCRSTRRPCPRIAQLGSGTAAPPRAQVCARYPLAKGHNRTRPQALPGSFCPMGTAPHDPGHSLIHPMLPREHRPARPRAPSALSPSAPQAQPICLPRELSLRRAPGPQAQPAPSHRQSSIFIISPGAALPCSRLPHGHSLPGGPLSVPRAQPAPQIQPAHLATPGHSAHRGASPSWVCRVPVGADTASWGACPPWGARGKGTASTISHAALSLHPPAWRAVGLGGLWGGCLWLSPPGALCPGAPSYLHGKKEERFGVRWQVI